MPQTPTICGMHPFAALWAGYTLRHAPSAGGKLSG